MVNHKTADLMTSLEGKQNSALTAEDLFGEILVLEKTLARLKEKILSVLPVRTLRAKSPEPLCQKVRNPVPKAPSSHSFRPDKAGLSGTGAKYGSDAWWERSDKEAIKQIENGEYFEVETKEELKAFLS
ncbi:MAG: hypothetical protein Q8N98_02750 [bacterium]|nr:hypothetical protein [bacterium]